MASKKRPTRTQLIKKADVLFSKIVRKIGYCEKCHGTKNLQCAHIMSRTNKNLRWNKDNAVCLCYRCHFFWAHKSPLEFAEWFRANYPIKYAFLIREANTKDYNLGQTLEFTIKKLEAYAK